MQRKIHSKQNKTKENRIQNSSFSHFTKHFIFDQRETKQNVSRRVERIIRVSSLPPLHKK